MLKTLGQRVLEILFPPICLNCRSYLQDIETRQNLLCHSCFSSIKIYSNIFYPDSHTSLLAVSSYENSALRELLHYFKYNGFLGAQAPLEKLIMKWLTTNSLLTTHLPPPTSCLIPIPLHKSRLRKRGFNQAELIAKILGKHLNLPVENLLERTRDTKSQIGMKSAKKRQENVKNSISVREKRGSLPQYQNVILVDDIYTSGSTMTEATRALRKAGIKNITAFVIAKT